MTFLKILLFSITSAHSKDMKHRTKHAATKIKTQRSAAPKTNPAATKRSLPPKPKKLTITLFGKHAVTEAWLNPQRVIHNVFITERMEDEFKQMVHQAKKCGLQRPSPTIVSKEQIDQSVTTDSPHQGIAIHCDDLPEVSLGDMIRSSNAAAKRCIVILDQVTDPHNVGAIIRSACAFGATGIVMQKKHAPNLNGILAKTACGGVEHLPVAFETNLSRSIKTLQENGYFVIGLDERGDSSLHKITIPEKTAIVLGAEGSGLRRLIRENCDTLCLLPTIPPILSLNVSNAAAIAVYEILTKS